MEEKLDLILSEIKKVNQRIDNLEKNIDKRFEEVYKYMDQRFEEVYKYIDQKFEEVYKYIDQKFGEVYKYIDKRFEKNTNEMSEILNDILELLERRFGNKCSDKEIIKEIKQLEERLSRKIKEDKETFKSNGARLNKIELTQEYFEVKIEDLKKEKSKEKVAI